jgi:ribosomal protein S18 acetylase RimI-like enzyme
MRPDQSGRAAEVFALAFHTDPSSIATVPDPVERARIMPLIGAWNIRLGLMYGEVLVTDGNLDGVLTVFTSEREGELEESVDDTIGELAERMGPEAWARNEELWPVWDIPHERMKEAVGEPHWYVDMLAVDPAWQGMGIGSALLQVVSDRADSDGRPCALFTYSERNVRLYERHGYEVVHAGETPIISIPYWCMKRPSK